MGSPVYDGVQHDQSDEENDEEINIYLKLIRTIPMKIKKSENARNVKTMLNEKEGIPECFQELFFSGDQIHDYSRLINHGIQQNSTLDVFVQTSVPLRLNIKIPSQKKNIMVETKTCDSIRHIKSLISKRESIPVHDFHLVYAGKSLEDDTTLASFVQEKNPTTTTTETLDMICTPKYQVPISVKTPAGKILETEVNVLQTVSDLKFIVESMAGFSLDDHYLTLNNEKLEDSKTLYYYNIQEQSAVEILCENTTIQVLITYGGGGGGEGGIIPQVLEVSRSNSVKDLEDKIFHQLRIPVHEQLLMCDGKLLLNNNNNNDCSLASFNIQNGSTITLIGLMN